MRDGTRRSSAETRLDQTDERSSVKDGATKRLRCNPEGGELDSAVDDCRRCKKNSPFVLSYPFILHIYFIEKGWTGNPR